MEETNVATHQLAQRPQLLMDRLAHRPTAEDLWHLHGVLLASLEEKPAARDADQLAREFYAYLSELESKMNARQYNELASRLDIGAIGVLALQDILFEHGSRWHNLLLGGAGEGLMVMASRQYVKAWEQELLSVQRRAAWYLYDVLWALSSAHQAEMSPQERQALIEATLAPALDIDVPFDARMLLLMRLFQTLLLLQVAPLYAP
jgi:hypothetical protein